MSDGCILVIGSFHDGVDWAGVLTETTVNAFGHIDVVAGGPTGAVRPRLAFNSDSSGWASGCAQFASNASFLTSCIAPEGMLSSEFGGKRPFFVRVVDGPLGLEGVEDGAVEERVEVFGHDHLREGASTLI